MEEKDRLLQRILSLTTSAPWTENLRLNRESIRTLCEEGMLGRIRRMYLTGGGTSLYAAEVGRSYMEPVSYTHLDVYKRQPLLSLRMARYPAGKRQAFSAQGI